METFAAEGGSISYDITGSGEPVILVHGALIAEAFRPLMTEPSLSRTHQRIIYHRRSYRDSISDSVSVSMAQQVADLRALADHLSISRGHFAGHSLGGSVCVQLALDSPGLVHSSALLEPALFGGSTGEAYRESLALAERRFDEILPESLVDGFLQMRFGPSYRSHLEQLLPGAFEEAVVDARSTFESDLPGLRAWDFQEEDARRITQPVLNVLGGESAALWDRFSEVYGLMQDWLPNTENFVLPSAAHGLMMQNPSGMAEQLAAFLKRHPID